MQTAIQLIRKGYCYAGIANEQTPLDPNKSHEGLEFLNELLFKWNLNNYFPFTQNTLDADVTNGKATIAPDSDDFKGEKPAVIAKVLWKNGHYWETLRRVSYETIWEMRGSGRLPSAYSYSNDEEGRGILIFDNDSGTFHARAIYNKSLPKMDYNDELHAPPQYEQLLKYGIAYKCCIRYALPPDVTQSIKFEQDTILRAIEKSNQFKKEVNIGRGRSWQSPADLVNTAYRLG